MNNKNNQIKKDYGIQNSINSNNSSFTTDNDNENKNTLQQNFIAQKENNSIVSQKDSSRQITDLIVSKKQQIFKKVSIILIVFICIILGLGIYLDTQYFSQFKKSKTFPELPLTFRTIPSYTGTFENLTLLDIQAKSSHNSQELNYEIIQQLTVFPDKPQNGGCLNIEIDIIPFQNSEDELIFLASHDKDNENYKLLEEELMDIEKWQKKQIIQIQKNKILYQQQQNQNNNNSNEQQIKKYQTYQFPIIISLDLKTSDDLQNFTTQQVIDKLDQILLKQIPLDKIYTPKDMLMQDDGKYQNETLLYIVQNKGYPKIVELIGKYLFIITGKDQQLYISKIRNEYAQQSKYRLSFVDIDSRSIYNNNQDAYNFLVKEQIKTSNQFPIYKDLLQNLELNPNCIFLNLKLQTIDQKDLTSIDRIKDNLNKAKELGGIVSRGWKCENNIKFNYYKHLNVNLITTDFVFDKCWTVLNDDYQDNYCKKLYLEY